MKIAIDLDDVTIDFVNDLLSFYNQKSGKSIRKEDVKTYNFWDVWGGTREEAVEIVNDFHDSDHFHKLKPVSEAIESIRELSKEHEIFFITARPIHQKEKTEKWIKKHLSETSINLIFTGKFHNPEKSKSKAEVCKELEIKLILEDSWNNAKECLDLGIKVILFTQPWNLSFNDSRMRRVNVWKEAMKLIENYKNQSQ